MLNLITWLRVFGAIGDGDYPTPTEAELRDALRVVDAQNHASEAGTDEMQRRILDVRDLLVHERWSSSWGYDMYRQFKAGKVLACNFYDAAVELLLRADACGVPIPNIGDEDVLGNSSEEDAEEGYSEAGGPDSRSLGEADPGAEGAADPGVADAA